MENQSHCKEKKYIMHFTYISILLFISLISSISTEEIEWIAYKASTSSGTYKHIKDTKIQTIGLDTEKINDNYFKITVTPGKGFSTPILIFSPTDPFCIKNRQIIARRADNSTAVLHVKNGGNNKNLYTQVICLEDNCRYTFNVKGIEISELDVNSVYSYLVSDYNKEMKFNVKGSATLGSYLTIGIEGSSSAELVIDDTEKSQILIDNGRIITFPIVKKNGSILSTFTVKGADEGDYITISVYVVSKGKGPEKLLYPNGPVVMGLLDEGEDLKEECFPVSAFTSNKFLNINKYYLTGRIYSKYGLFWMADENCVKMDETEFKITDGLLSYEIETNGLKRFICFGFLSESPVKSDYVAFSISILEPVTLESLYNFYPPQTIGQMYRRMIPKGRYAVYSAAKVNQNDQRINFNLYNRKGIAEMYVDNCTTFPECSYMEEDFLGLEKPKRVNRMTLWDTPLDDTYNALDSGRNVMIVFCKDDDNENNGYCEFDTSINVIGKEIYLVENEQFSKYSLKADKGIFKLDFKGGIEIKVLTIDIMIYSGDVTFNVINFDDNNSLNYKNNVITYIKYYLSNKIFYQFNFPKIYYNSIELEYKAEANSFFTIKYQINPYDSIQSEEKILSDETYLIQIDPSKSEKYKTIYLSNNRIKKEQAFLVNFYSLNCDFQVIRENTNDQINFFKGFGHEIITPSTAGYNWENYIYRIGITKIESSDYQNKMCMLYVSGYESSYETEIVLAENLNQRIAFNTDFNKVRFLYPHTGTKDLAISIKIINTAKFNIRFFINSESNPFIEENIFRSKIYFISEIQLESFCKIDTLCNIIAQIECTNNLENNLLNQPTIEIFFRPILNTPAYLKRNEIKSDFSYDLVNLYLYTDIGKNDIAEITVNYFRDFGKIYGKIVRKYQNISDENAEWRDLYTWPSENLKSLEFNGYTKKLTAYAEDTKNCLEGCYLLLSIQVAQPGYFGIFSKFYPFSILTKIMPNNYIYSENPIIAIDIDEYIIGNVDVSQDEKIYQLYEIFLPKDSDYVQFDFQSEVAQIYINLGKEGELTTKKYDFRMIPPGRSSILSLDKKSILEKAQNKNIKLFNSNSLENINLVIGIWTNKTDSDFTEIFSLRVHLPNINNDMDITEINAEPKILCKPNNLNESHYNCLFMVTFTEEEANLGLSLLIHAESVNKTRKTQIYGNFIDKNYFEENDIENLRNLIPNDNNAQFSTERIDSDYIYTTINPSLKSDNKLFNQIISTSEYSYSLKGEKYYYLYLNVISDNSDEIAVLTSMPRYNLLGSNEYQFYPSPNTENLLYAPDGQLRLTFLSNSSIIVYIVALEGEGYIKWANNPNNIYRLSRRGERLEMISGKINDELIIEKRSTSNNKLGLDNSDFIFYITYYTRNPEINFDKVIYGSMLTVAYKETDLPIYLYSKIEKCDNDINVVIHFKDLDIFELENYDSFPLFFVLSFGKENTIYIVKNSPDLQPKVKHPIIEKYDGAIKILQLYIPKEIFDIYSISDEDNPVLYLSIEKGLALIKHNYIFEKINFEIEISMTNNGIPPIENFYHYGKHNGKGMTNYKLRKNKNKEYMMIEISFNSDNLDFSVNEMITKNNSTNLIENSKKERGKITMAIKTNDIDFIYLNIFNKEDKSIDDRILNNYVFKYMNVEKVSDYIQYHILNNKDELIIDERKENGNTFIDCIFNKIDLEKYQANITYSFKIIEEYKYYKGESFESIALTESPYVLVTEKNPSDNNGAITLTTNYNLTNIIYLQVIAIIEQENNKEFISYKSMKYPKHPDQKDEEEKGKEEEIAREEEIAKEEEISKEEEKVKEEEKTKEEETAKEEEKVKEEEKTKEEEKKKENEENEDWGEEVEMENEEEIDMDKSESEKSDKDEEKRDEDSDDDDGGGKWPDLPDLPDLPDIPDLDIDIDLCLDLYKLILLLISIIFVLITILIIMCCALGGCACCNCSCCFCSICKNLISLLKCILCFNCKRVTSKEIERTNSKKNNNSYELDSIVN